MKANKELMWNGGVLINVLEGGMGKTVFTGGKRDKSLSHPLQRGAAIVNTAVEYGSDRLGLRWCDGDLASQPLRQEDSHSAGVITILGPASADLSPQRNLFKAKHTHRRLEL